MYGDTMTNHRKPPAVAALAVALTTLSVPPAESADADKLETLIVRAAREPQAPGLIGSAFTVLDGELLAQRQTASLAEILRSVPGVAVSRAGVSGSQTQLRMRGGESNQVLVFIDGVRANDPAQNGEFNFAHLLNAELASVEVIRGPQSALWGSDALSGVINVSTRNGDSGVDGGIFAEGGSNSWQQLGASGRYGNKRVRASISVNDLETDGENISRQGSEDDGYQNTTANGRASLVLTDALSLDGSLRYVDANNQFDGIDFGSGLPADTADETDVEQWYGRMAVSLGTVNDRWRHSLSLALTDTDNKNRTENAFAPSGFDIYTTEAEVTVITAQSSFDLAAGHTLTAAWERIEEDFKQRGPVGFGDPNRDEDIDSDSFVGEYRGRLGEHFSVLASVRRDDNSDFDDKTTGRVSGAWEASQATTLRGAWGTGIKNPTFTERFGFFTDFVGNPDLQPEESTGWEIGVDQRLLDNQLRLSLTWFEEELEDEINGFVFDPASGGFTADNEDGESRRQGLELGGQWQLSKTLSLSGAYTWLDATENDPSGGDIDEIRRAEHIANANLNWVILGGRGNLNINVDYNGEQDDLFFPPTPPFQERVELDDFVLVGVAANYRVWRTLELFARVENALDEDYEEVFGYVAPGRMLIGGLRYRFNGD
jgi:vitamin B12 transporter